MVYDIGKIDLSIYKVVTKNIQTDEVIITDERMKHIQEHHPGDFENICDKEWQRLIRNKKILYRRVEEG